MNRLSLLAAMLVFFLLLSQVPFASEEAGFKSMFNGTDLTGWEGKPGKWWVEEGAITGQSTVENPCPEAHYLYWKEAEPSDFILRFNYKIEGGNSGVQFRSEKRPNFDTWGYQADIEDGEQWTGCLFQHDRGGVVMRGFKAIIAKDGTRTETPIAPAEDLLNTVKKNDWNAYEIECRESRIILRINDVVMCEVEDQDEKMACKKGIIALQMHPGPPMKIQFKELRIKILEESK